MQTNRLVLSCPTCGSAEVFYTCTPNCCFNHACAACSTTFEPATTLKGGTLSGIVPPDPLPDASDPTVECAKCNATTVYMTADGSLVCATCGSLLVLEITEVAPG